MHFEGLCLRQMATAAITGCAGNDALMFTMHFHPQKGIVSSVVDRHSMTFTASCGPFSLSRKPVLGHMQRSFHRKELQGCKTP